MATDWTKVEFAHVMQACNQIDENSPAAPSWRKTHALTLSVDDRYYPAEFVRTLAYKIATGVELSLDSLATEKDTIQFFDALGLKTRIFYEEPPELTDEDNRILDAIIEKEVAEQERRLKQYAPVMAALVEILKVLDSEAQPLPDGIPLGLWWYARHACRGKSLPKQFKNEEKWSSRIKELLDANEISTLCEERYPLPPERYCDLVINWPQLGRLWLEVKGAWRHNNASGTERNKPYRKHLFAAGDDIGKVCTLDETTTDHFGLLLVGFDTASDPIPDKDIELVRSRPTRAGWVEQYHQWNDLRRNGRVRVWLFLNEAKYVPDIFD